MQQQLHKSPLARSATDMESLSWKVFLLFVCRSSEKCITSVHLMRKTFLDATTFGDTSFIYVLRRSIDYLPVLEPDGVAEVPGICENVPDEANHF